MQLNTEYVKTELDAVINAYAQNIGAIALDTAAEDELQKVQKQILLNALLGRDVGRIEIPEIRRCVRQFLLEELQANICADVETAFNEI